MLVRPIRPRSYAVSLLGNTRVATAGGQASLKPSLGRSLLELLAMRAGEPVPVELIAEELWEATPPAQPRQAVQAHVRRLRRVLDVSGVPTDALPIRSAGGGYVLDIPAHAVDALHMITLVDDATTAPVLDTESVVAILGQALDIWFGEPFGGLADGPWHRNAVRYWGEVRSLALRAWAGAHLRLNRPQPVITRLHATRLGDSTDEGLIILLISALCQVGRKVEALETYRSLRNRLVSQYGVEPSPDLQRFYQQILLDDGDARFQASLLLAAVGT